MSGVYFDLASGNFSQNWTNTGLITTNDDWSGVPSVQGFRGDDLTTAVGVDPTTLTGDPAAEVIDVNANQTNPNTFTTGGVAEFDSLADPTIALQGSGTADAPHIVLYLNATGREALHLDLDLRDIDGSADNAVQPIAIQYRVGASGAWTNVTNVADATTGGSATQVTHVSVDLPAATANQAQVQVRIMTTNAVGNDEWVGIDNIVVTSAAVPPPPPPSLYFSLAGGDFSQDWSNAGLISANDDWSGVPNIIGYRGDDITGATGADPRTLPGDGTVVMDVNANQSNPNTFTTGGVAEFAIADPTIALQGSGTADAPYIVLHLDATGRKNVHLELDVRDIDGSADNATQQFNLQYRIGESGAWTNVSGGYVADATEGAAATLVTHVAVDLPAEVNGQPQIQIRMMTTNAVGNDEWIGLDNIVATSQPDTDTAVSITGGSVVEGDAGTTSITFTVARADNTGDFTLHFASQDGTASAGSDYDALLGDLHFTAGGSLSQTITVVVHGDLEIEGNETFRVVLSDLVNNAGSAVLLGSGQATGTILADDFNAKINQIQGASHTSPLVGLHVITTGIVTAIDTTGARGFWIQDPDPDANDATSEAIFVFTGALPTVAVGDSVRVEGNVAEFQGSAPNNLTVTEIDAPVVTVLSSGNALPAAIVLGAGGRLVPTEVIDNDNFSVFDPGQDAIDFYESLEGMRVTAPDVQAVAPTMGNTTWVVSNQGVNATGMNSVGGITISEGDFNPERLQIFFDSGVSPAGVRPDAVTGDDLGDVSGILHYFGGDYELLPTSIGNTGSGPIVLPRETTALQGDADHLTVGAFNVENLDPLDPQEKIDALAANIRFNLGSPDIVGLEEVQDADGPGNGTNFSGALSAQKLIDAIAAAGGPTYLYVEVAPTANNTTGGENNGNIRQGYLYNPDRVGFVSVSQITDTTPANGDTYANSRKPLVGVFTFNGETITLIDVHNTSRGGSDALFGVHQPALNEGDARRIEQTLHVKTYVENLVALNPAAKVVVLGDFNAFQFETSLTQLEAGGALSNLTRLLPTNEQFSYNFDGNSQQLDHMLASPGLQSGAQFDIVHLNSNQAVVNQTTDHDGSVARFHINLPIVAVDDTASVNENEQVVIDVVANDLDSASDTKTLVSVSPTANGGHVTIVDGKAVYVADAPQFDLLGPGDTATDSFTYVVRDGAGVTSTATVTVTITGVPDGPTQLGGNGKDSLAGTGGEDRMEGGNGADVLFGAAGADTLLGGNGGDVLNGGAGADQLTGGNGPDTFEFLGAFGHDTVVDLANEDRIRLDDAQFADFAAVLAQSAQVGADVVITLDPANSITLQNVTLGSLNSGDFLFA